MSIFTNKIKNISRFWPQGLIFVLAITFFCGASYFNFKTQDADFIKWTSPDETANYIFTKLYAQEGSLSIPERFNIQVSDIIHPRSFRTSMGLLTPMSFLGMILLYGKLASLVGWQLIPYFTPFLAAVGVFFFYLLIKRIFNRDTAFLSALLLAAFPVYFYYASRSMFHNIPFAVFLIMSFYGMVMMAGKDKIFRRADYLKKNYWSIFAGAFLGLAVITRTSELLWLAPFLTVFLAFNFRQLTFFRLVLFSASLFAVCLPVAWWNTLLYGSFFNTGYPQMNNSLVQMSQTGVALAKTTGTVHLVEAGVLLQKLKDTVFYFGFTPRRALEVFWLYSYGLFPWLIVGSISGFALWLIDFKKWRRAQIFSIVFLAVVAPILILYYGSWDFHDNPDASKITIANSYTRYWLPIYMVLIAWASFFLVKVTSWLRPSLAWLIRILAVGLVVYISLLSVWSGSDDAIESLVAKNQPTREQWREVLKLTEGNSVLITRYHDKLFFPERKVILGLFDDDGMIVEYAKLAKYLPVYYYNFTLPERDFNYLNEKRLPKFGLSLRLIKNINEDFTLYKIEILSNDQE